MGNPRWILWACSLLLPGLALGAELDDDGPRRHALSVGAGALWFLEAGLVPLEEASPAWTVRYAYEPLEVLAIELAWIGNTDFERRVGRMRLANVFEYDLRVNLAPRAPIVPFAAAGLGYASFFGAPEDTDLAMVTVPLAAGLEIRGRDFLIAGRATWRQAWYDDVAHSSLGADHLTATISVGQRF